jgi:putative endopeptidase
MRTSMPSAPPCPHPLNKGSRIMLKHTLTAVALLTLGACSSDKPAPAREAPPKAKIGNFGLALQDGDAATRPGVDFYRHAVGHWLDTHEIPADRTAWGTFYELDSESEKRVRGLIEALPQQAAAGSTEQQVSDYYRAFLNTDAIERAGLEPARAALAEIAAARTHEDIATLMGRPDLPVSAPIGIRFDIDEKDPDRYAVIITQAGLGLPDRDYYLKKEAEFADIREKYRAHIARMLGLAGERDVWAKAKEILALETAIARDHWPIEKRRERELTYNAKTRAELDKLAPRYPWKAQLTAGGIDAQPQFVVAELDAVRKLGARFRATPVDQWRAYLEYHFLANVADVLPKAFDDEGFDFYGRTLNGQKQQRDRWKRGVDAVDGALGDAVGQLYVAKYFPEGSKAKMLDLVENLRKAYSARVKELPWMSEETKKVALEKLETFRPKIGYPDKWREYGKLEVRAGDAFGNALRSNAFEWRRQADRLGEKTDRDEWMMTPYTVNAYYNPTFNEIVFPAAILEPPFFDPNADAAVNYGAIGGVIGHEMGHGFDDQGAKSDARGVLRTWWQPADETSFKKLGDALVKQYDAYEALPGLKLNGRLTLGENIGDLGGLTVALEAYRLSLGGKEAPVLDGQTGQQRFFLSWAQAWRSLYRDERLRNLVMADPHSPAKFRVNGVVRNMDAWYEAFKIEPEDPLYLAPEERVRIW